MSFGNFSWSAVILVGLAMFVNVPAAVEATKKAAPVTPVSAPVAAVSVGHPPDLSIGMVFADAVKPQCNAAEDGKCDCFDRGGCKCGPEKQCTPKPQAAEVKYTQPEPEPVKPVKAAPKPAAAPVRYYYVYPQRQQPTYYQRSSGGCANGQCGNSGRIFPRWRR